ARPTPTERASALGRLSPQAYTLLPRLVVQSLDAKDAQIQSYLADRRNGTDSSPARTLGTKGGVNMMLMGDIRNAKYDGTTDRPQVKTDSRSIAFAIDYEARPGIIVGATVGIDGLDARLDPTTRPRITLFNSNVGTYASITNGRVYVNAAASYNYGDYKLRRQVDVGTFSNQLTANTDSDAWTASGETGYTLKRGKARIEPFAGLLYRNVSVSGFQEQGAAAALQVANYRTRSLQSALGVRASASPLIVRSNWSLRPTVQAEWRRELRGKGDSRIEARFASGGSPVFALQPTRLARDFATASLGITATYKDRTSVRLAYNGQLSSDRQIHGAVLSLSRRF
ncbi:MAG: hypothetical protein JWR77_1161, partial [Rhizorhabdus sp.]|nr:hypothetical protein [Rhizorhabdus sp.]